MVNYRDFVIKLFGTTIALQLDEESLTPVVLDRSESVGDDEKDLHSQITTPEHKEQVAQSSDSQEDTEAPKPEDMKPDSSVTENVKATSSASENHADATSSSKSKTLKKPDKILSCPRCSSTETKFCYYNNHNVKQPRHFCKHCQRYWTDGGTMRNVPVGAGRRKSKSSTSQHREFTICNPAAPSICTDIAESIPYFVKPNGSVLSFGSQTPLNISMGSILDHAEKSIKGFNTSCPSIENDHSELLKEYDLHISSVTPCINRVPWPYSWAQIAEFSEPSFAVPLYPAAAYWTISPITSNPTENCSKRKEANSNITLGKVSRSDIMQNDQETSHSSPVPKTMRIGNPQEAGKSSIWSMIGNKNGQGDASKCVGLFGAFQSKVEMKDHAMEASRLLHANPAAQARYMIFQERS